MTMTELSRSYEEAAMLLRSRLRYLRQALAATGDPEEIWHIRRRIAELTAHYYDRGYWRNEKYTV